jgi:hypothetical protein
LEADSNPIILMLLLSCLKEQRGCLDTPQGCLIDAISAVSLFEKENCFLSIVKPHINGHRRRGKTTANLLTPMNMSVMGLIIPAALGQHARSWTSCLRRKIAFYLLLNRISTVIAGARLGTSPEEVHDLRQSMQVGRLGRGPGVLQKNHRKFADAYEYERDGSHHSS